MNDTEDKSGSFSAASPPSRGWARTAGAPSALPSITNKSINSRRRIAVAKFDIKFTSKRILSVRLSDWRDKAALKSRLLWPIYEGTVQRPANSRENERGLRLKGFLCATSVVLCVSVVKIRYFTTEAQRVTEGAQSFCSQPWPEAKRSAQASANADSGLNSVGLRPPVHLRTESIKTITAAVMIRTVSDVLM